MGMNIQGLHHITAIASEPQKNYDFYTEILGLKLVKKTINFDDPGTYHLYFGDQSGAPGTIMTFFLWPGARRGVIGKGQATVSSFEVPADSLAYWRKRFAKLNVPIELKAHRFGEEALAINDPDGLKLELVGVEETTKNGWENGSIPGEYAIRGFHGVTLSIDQNQRSERLLTEIMGYRKIDESSERVRYSTEQKSVGSYLDILIQPTHSPGRMGAGTVHHVAFRAQSDAEQVEWREALIKNGFDVSPIMDRTYFHSIYFRQPGGVLFEIATDPPGFLLDETLEGLGSELKMPSWLEPRRTLLEETLPSLKTRRPGDSQ